MIATIAGTAMAGVTIIITLQLPSIRTKIWMENQKGEPGGSPFC